MSGVCLLGSIISCSSLQADVVTMIGVLGSDHFLRVGTHVVASLLDVGGGGESDKVCRFTYRAQHVFLTVDRVVRTVVLHRALKVC